jgi:hypothetical protein
MPLFQHFNIPALKGGFYGNRIIHGEGHDSKG